MRDQKKELPSCTRETFLSPLRRAALGLLSSVVSAAVGDAARICSQRRVATLRRAVEPETVRGHGPSSHCVLVDGIASQGRARAKRQVLPTSVPRDYEPPDLDRMQDQL